MEYTYRMTLRPLTDYTNITAWLERMAQKGWMLDYIGNVFWKFRKTEPRKVHFSAVYLPIDCNAFSPARTPEAEELEALCEGTGWYWVSSMYQLQIFANEEPDPAPLDSDPVVQVESLHRAMLQNILPGQILLLVFTGIMALLCWSSMFAGRLHSGFGQFLAAALFTLVVAMELGEIALYYIWHKQAEADAQTGVLRPTRSFPGVTAMLLVISITVFFLWLGALPWRSQLGALFNMLAFILVRVIAEFGRKNKEMSSWAQVGVIAFLVIWVLFYPIVTSVITGQIESERWSSSETVLYEGTEYVLVRDEIPLRTEDLMDIDTTLQSYYCDVESFFPCRITHNTQHQLYGNTGTPRLYYTIWDYPLDLYRDNFLSQAMNTKFYPTHVELDPEIWEAQAVYRLCQNGEPQNMYIICWEGRIVSLQLQLDTTNPELTAEQIATIVEKLKP